jgi:selenocysteine lyase/cysteine desulfurase
MKRLGTVATVRASLALYSSADEVERLVEGLRQIPAVLGP